MNRSVTVAFALIFSVLMITAVPANVSAASEQLVVGSEHSTDTELQNGTLTNMKVSGTGDSAVITLTETKRIEYAFRDTNFDLNYKNSTDLVKDVVGAEFVGGIGDFDGDGNKEIAYTFNTELQLWEIGGGSSYVLDSTGSRINTNGVGDIGDFDGDGDLDIAYADQNNNLKYVDNSGNVVDTGQQVGGSTHVGGLGDIDNDGDLDLAFISSTDEVKYIDESGNVVSTGATAGNIGDLGDIDGDGDLEIAYRDLNDNLKHVDKGGNVVDTGIQAKSVGNVMDIDEDGDQDIAFADSNSNLKYVDDSGNVVDTGYQADDVGVAGSPGGVKTPAKYVSTNHSVSNAEQAAFNITSITDMSATLTAEYWDGTSWQQANQTSVATAGEHTLGLPNVSSSKWRVRVNATKTGGSPAFKMRDESILFIDQAPVVDAASASPSGGVTVQTQSPTLSINVTDREFGATQGDTVTATAYDASDDSQIGATTLNANGTASVTWSDPLTGSNSYYWVVEDSYGESTTTQDFSFKVPGTLRVFNESAPSTKINDTVGLRVRFFATEDGTVVERDVTNGTADLTGLPADQPIAITLKDETDGYVYRRITIDSIVEQQDIYLLPTQANSVQVVFELEDPTGQFAPEETRLLVEKPIKKDFDGDGSNETRYQIVSGDLFGSSGQYPAQLLQDERYRLRVLTEDGNERILGSYTAFGPATEPLQIEQIEPKADQDAGEALYGDVEVADGGNTTTATIRYQNLGDESTTVEYRILAGNQTVIGNVTSDADTFAHVYNVSSANATTFTVEYMIQKPTTTEYGQFKLGGIAGVAGRLSIDAQVLSIISWLLILSTMGLVVIVDPKLAPAGGTGMASGLVILGTVAIPAPVLGVAGAVSVLTLVGGGES